MPATASFNLGSGDRYVSGWWNVDRLDCPHRKDQAVDLTADLPWLPETVQQVYAGHLLEHLTLRDCTVLVARLLPLMVHGGQLMVVGPNVPEARRRAEAGTLDVVLDGLVRGGHRWPGDEHQWQCHHAPIVNMLELSGWAGVTVMSIGDVPDFWPVADRGPTWQFGVTAHRP